MLAAPPEKQKQQPYTPAADLKGRWAFKADPALPNVLILGDSISIAYTLPVREKLRGKANVFRPMRPDKQPDNCGDTPLGLAKLDQWLGDTRWDVIHFNWGLWDLCYRHPESKEQGNRDKVNGKVSTPPEDYERNLEKLVARLKATGATLVWASTTVVPDGEAGRFVGDDVKYNAIAARVMERHQIPDQRSACHEQGVCTRHVRQARRCSLHHRRFRKTGRTGRRYDFRTPQTRRKHAIRIPVRHPAFHT